MGVASWFPKERIIPSADRVEEMMIPRVALMSRLVHGGIHSRTIRVIR